MTPDPLAALLWDAILEVWPTHIEGISSMPPSPHDRTWKVLDPAIPSTDTADDLAARLRARGVTVGDGLREAVIQRARAVCTDWAGDPDFGPALDRLTDAVTALDAALTGDTGPKVEPEPGRSPDVAPDGIEAARVVKARADAGLLTARDNFDTLPDPDVAPETGGLREAAQAALDLLPDLSVAYHQVGSIRDHADPKDRTGWNVHGIETCDDSYCLDALAAIAALRAALGPWREASRRLIANGDDDEGSAA